MLTGPFSGNVLMAAHEQEKEIDLDALYQQIDEAIEQAEQYNSKREKEIIKTNSLFKSENNPEKKLQLACQLFDLYKPYRNEQAVNFAEICINIAESLHRPDIAGLYRSLQARQYSNVGLYVEALDRLRQVNKSALDTQGLTAYYEAWMHVYGQLGSFTQLKHLRQRYFDKQDLYRDSVLMTAEEGSEEFLHLKMDVLSARRQYQDALDISDKWLGNVTDGTHENAFAAFYRSVVYDKLNNQKQSRYWLGKSALDDIKCAVLDQAALIMLAERLSQDGDHERAYRYASFSRECNTAYYPYLRNYQTNAVINVINQSRKAYQDSNRRLLIIASVAVVLLLLAVIGLYLSRRRAASKVTG